MHAWSAMWSVRCVRWSVECDLSMQSLWPPAHSRSQKQKVKRQRTMASRDLTTTFQERRAAANMRRRKAGNGGMKPFGEYAS